MRFLPTQTSQGFSDFFTPSPVTASIQTQLSHQTPLAAGSSTCSPGCWDNSLGSLGSGALLPSLLLFLHTGLGKQRGSWSGSSHRIPPRIPEGSGNQGIKDSAEEKEPAPGFQALQGHIRNGCAFLQPDVSSGGGDGHLLCPQTSHQTRHQHLNSSKNNCEEAE